jgi:hypothetical protein
MLSSSALAGSLPVLKYRALDNSGNAMSGAKLYFYEDGTTTPLATYSDEALTTANTNPVVADSSGYFGEIYLKTDEQYKVVLKTSAGVTIWTVDDITASQLVSDSFEARIGQAATNPLDYGAIGDGVANEVSYVQTAIDAATGVVDLLGKTYRCDSVIAINSGETGVVIKNGTLDFSNSTAGSNVYIYGTIGSANSLTGDANIGATTLAVTSSTGLAAGDWLILSSGNAWSVGLTRGELVQIDSIAGLNITLKKPIEATYQTALLGSVYDITQAPQRIRFDNVRFIGNTSAVGTGDMVYIDYMAFDIAFENCTFDNVKRYAIASIGGCNVHVDRCTFTNIASSGAAIATSGPTQNLMVTNNRFSRVPLGVGVGLSGTVQTRYTTIRGNTFEGVTQGIVVGLSSQYTSIDDNDIIGDTSGGSGTGDGIMVLSPDATVTNNRIREAGGNGILVDTDSVTYDSGKSHSMVITGNRIWEPDDSGIDVEDSSSPGLSHLIIDGNEIYGGTYGLYVRNSTAIMHGNSVVDSSSHGIFIYLPVASANFVVDSNNVVNPGDNGIYASTAAVALAGLVVSNNTVKDVDEAGDVCIGVSSDATGTVTGITISGNTLERDDDLDDSIQLSGGAAGAVTRVVVSDNNMSNGAYGIGEPTDANATNVVIGPNYWDGIATAEYEGTVTPVAVALSAANTVCSTTCGTFTCLFGYDDATNAAVACSNIIADHCVCYP